MFRGRRMAAWDIYFAGSVAGQGMAGFGATLSFPRVPAKVPSPSDLPTFVIVHCQRAVFEFTTYALESRLRAS